MYSIAANTDEQCLCVSVCYLGIIGVVSPVHILKIDLNVLSEHRKIRLLYC